MHRVIIPVLAILLLAGCAPTDPSSTTLATVAPSAPAPSETADAPAEPGPANEAESDRTDVPWSDYAETVKSRIDELTIAADCAGLQGEFDTADANNDSTRARTGHGNVELMNYIDESMQLAECY